MLMDYCVCIDFRLAMISQNLELWVQVFTVKLNPEDRGLGQGCRSLVHQLPLSSGWVQIPALPLISVFLPLSKPHLTYPWFGHNDLEHSQNLVTHIGVTLSHPATVTRDQNSLGPSEPTGLQAGAPKRGEADLCASKAEEQAVSLHVCPSAPCQSVSPQSCNRAKDAGGGHTDSGTAEPDSALPPCLSPS